MKDICKDLAAECQALDDVVSKIDDADWQVVTPFDGWTVKDEIAHLAYFDMLARLSASDKEGFDKEMAVLIEKFETLFEYTLEPGLAKIQSGAFGMVESRAQRHDCSL